MCVVIYRRIHDAISTLYITWWCKWRTCLRRNNNSKNANVEFIVCDIYDWLNCEHKIKFNVFHIVANVQLAKHTEQVCVGKTRKILSDPVQKCNQTAKCFFFFVYLLSNISLSISWNYACHLSMCAHCTHHTSVDFFFVRQIVDVKKTPRGQKSVLGRLVDSTSRCTIYPNRRNKKSNKIMTERN